MAYIEEVRSKQGSRDWAVKQVGGYSFIGISAINSCGFICKTGLHVGQYRVISRKNNNILLINLFNSIRHTQVTTVTSNL